MKKKKILFASYDLNIGGIEKSLITLLNNMNYDKYDITLILERKEGVFLDKLNDQVKLEEYKVSTSKNIFFRKIFNYIKRIIWIIKNYHRYDFSCCYATYSYPCNFIGYYGSKNNSIYIHSNYKNIYDEYNLRYFFDTRRINKFKKIIFVSNEARNDLIKFYPYINDKSVVINNLVNYKEILELSKEKINLKKKFKKLFVFVGRLEEDSKRISKLIKVFKDFDNLELWIIGDGPDKNMYESMIDSLSNIKMLGPKKNPYPYMKLADYIILTSDYEGFPVVYNEAIVLNKKIITTIDVSDEFISIKDRFGYIIDKDIDIMKKEIISILNNDNLEIEQVDFNKLNKERIHKLESIIEGNHEI